MSKGINRMLKDCDKDPVQMVDEIALASVEAEASLLDDDSSLTSAAGDHQPKPSAPDNVDVPHTDVFDPAWFLAKVDGDEEVLREVVELFLDDSHAVLSQVRESIEGQDAEGLARAAHSLKGAVSNFGSSLALQAARKMESLARRGDLDGARDGLGRLDDEVSRLRQRLSELIKLGARSAPADDETRLE